MELFNYPAKSGDWTYLDFPGVLGVLASLGGRNRMSVLEQVRIWDRQECMSMTVIRYWDVVRPAVNVDSEGPELG